MTKAVDQHRMATISSNNKQIKNGGHNVISAAPTLKLSSLFLFRLNSLTKHAEVTNLVSSCIADPCGRVMPEHANNMFSSAQCHDLNH
jgi:hypothetical protein